MRLRSIRPEFVTFVPERLEPGVIYVSIEYATATHLCACGCGEPVVTPIRPADWTITWDGEAITLRPSIGNWSLACQSHYWIIESRVVWARALTRHEISVGRAKVKRLRARYLEAKNKGADAPASPYR